MRVCRFLGSVFAAMLMLLAGCAGSGAGLDQNGRPIGSETGTGTLTPDFPSIQSNVFTPICSVCHAGGAAPQGMRLDAANSYAMIVGVPSTEEPSILRIKPGDPDHSYLIQKIEGVAAVGAQMPFGGPPLPAATITTMRQWVTNGAPQVIAPPPAVFAVASIAPAMNDIVLESPARIVVAFTRELDRTRLDAESLRLERLPLGRADEPEAITYAVSVPEGNPSALILTPSARLGDGVYRLIVRASPATGISAIDGTRLGNPAHDTVLSVFAVEATP